MIHPYLQINFKQRYFNHIKVSWYCYLQIKLKCNKTLQVNKTYCSIPNYLNMNILYILYYFYYVSNYSKQKLLIFFSYTISREVQYIYIYIFTLKKKCYNIYSNHLLKKYHIPVPLHLAIFTLVGKLYVYFLFMN